MGLGLVLVGLVAGVLGSVLALIYGAGLWWALLIYMGLGCLGTLLAAGLILWRAATLQDQRGAQRVPATPLPHSPGQQQG